jgi:hypothetical protein
MNGSMVWRNASATDYGDLNFCSEIMKMYTTVVEVGSKNNGHEQFRLVG